MPILRIRDESGKFIPINAIKGDDGKSAYEQAQEGGYKGTLEDFIAILNGLTNTEEANHYVDYNNPHKVSTSQIGAIPAQYSFPKDLDTELRQGVNKMSVCGYYSSTLNSPYKQNVSPRTHGMVITNCASEEYAAQMALPSGEDAIYVRQLYAGEVSDWVRIMDERQVRDLQADIADVRATVTDTLTPKVDAMVKTASGTYTGTGTDGYDGELTITLPFVPQMVVIVPTSDIKVTDKVSYECSPMVMLYGMNYVTGGSMRKATVTTSSTNYTDYVCNAGCIATWNGNVVSLKSEAEWENKELASIHLYNYAGAEYKYFAIGVNV